MSRRRQKLYCSMIARRPEARPTTSRLRNSSYMVLLHTCLSRLQIIFSTYSRKQFSIPLQQAMKIVFLLPVPTGHAFFGSNKYLFTARTSLLCLDLNPATFSGHPLFFQRTLSRHRPRPPLTFVIGNTLSCSEGFWVMKELLSNLS